MALTVNTNIINDTDQYLLDAKNVKGTYVVVATTEERDNLPIATTLEGSLCYCQADDKFYQYNGNSWEESKLNHEAPTRTSELTNDSDFATTQDITDAIEAIPEVEAISDSEIIALFSS